MEKEAGNERMEHIYVCSPLRPKARDPEEARVELERNLERAAQVCRLLANIGAVPIAPHLYCTQFLDDSIREERKTGMKIGRELLMDCDELWVFSEHISSGMAQEINIASEMGIAVRMISQSKGFLRKLQRALEGVGNEE